MQVPDRPTPEGSAGGSASGDAETSTLVLDASPDAVREGRRFAVRATMAAGASTLADDVALVASELLANACQHGEPPVTLTVAASAAAVRLEVHDSGSGAPIRTLPNDQNMTGRGLAVVESLTAAWGVDRVPGDGKTVWCELRTDGAGGAETGDPDLDAVLAAWGDDPPGAEQRYAVVLGDVPTSLLLEAKAHIDNLVREFTLAASGSAADGVEVPAHLARLIDTVVNGFSEARTSIKRQAIAAVRRGEAHTRLTLYLPMAAADAGEAYLAALDQADTYSRAARLLTLETPPGHRVFRRWYVTAVVEQLRAAAAGRTPKPALSFQETLLREVERLSAKQRANERAVRLQRVTAALARARTPEDVAAVVVSEGVHALDAAGGSLLVPAEDGEHLSVPGWVGYGAELVGQLRTERADAPLPAATAMRTGEAVWLESRQERDRRFPMLRGFEPSTIAMCAVPLESGGQRLGALRLSFDTPRLFDEDERHFVLALAALTAQTLERSELYLAERKATVTLQRALLPRAIAAVPGWNVAAHYSPAGDQQVGGDWFDIVPLPDGGVVAVVGDVMGRGLEAASAMAEIRSAVRAFVSVDPDPVVVLGKVDELFRVLDLDQLATLLYMYADPATGKIQISNAGHLPPLLVHPDRPAERLDVPPGLPFGAGPDERTAVVISVAPGASLVAVTDGLVERRGEDIDEGLERLLALADLADHRTAESLLHRIVTAGSTDREHDDDVTVLVLRRDSEAPPPAPSGGQHPGAGER